VNRAGFADEDSEMLTSPLRGVESLEKQDFGLDSEFRRSEYQDTELEEPQYAELAASEQTHSSDEDLLISELEAEDDKQIEAIDRRVRAVAAEAGLLQVGY